MFTFKLLVILATCLSWTHCKNSKYCSFCDDHTMCIYKGVGDECKDLGSSGISARDKFDILAEHNRLRRRVATGKEERGVSGPQPKAANMMKIVWDDEIAAIAQRWADQCTFKHDTCRNVARWKVGQNIYHKMQEPKGEVNWTGAIHSWYEEVSLHDGKEVKFYKFKPETGHYTQMMWHDTHAIGCGRRDYGPNKIYVCNYGPAGNFLGQPVYEVGKPCSKCPQGSYCDEFLCSGSPAFIPPLGPWLCILIHGLLFVAGTVGI